MPAEVMGLTPGGSLQIIFIKRMPATDSEAYIFRLTKKPYEWYYNLCRRNGSALWKAGNFASGRRYNQMTFEIPFHSAFMI